MLPILEQALELKDHEFRMNSIKVLRRWVPDLPRTLVDGHQLTEALVGILNNSQQSMVEAHGGGELVISTALSAGYIQISISDDGTGIAPEHMPKIFDPFFTTKGIGEGTGLGLSTCYGIVSQHGGKIWAESTAGAGATFHILLPILKGTPQDQPRQVEPEPTRVDAKRILVVDDEPEILEILSQVLTSAGHQVDLTNGGEEAWVKVQETSYDRLFLDLKMPGMSGQQLYHLINDHDSELAAKVVFITGDTLSPESGDFLANTGNLSLAKPFSWSQLLEALED